MLKKFYEFKESDLEPIKSFYLKDELNTDVWDDFKINKTVREELLKIAQDFYDSLDLGTDIKDIILTGSLANYNWSKKYSDFDLHIVVDLSDVDENEELVKKYVDSAKINWNEKHDVKISGYEVEIYVQDMDEEHQSSGVFSLFNNKWKVKPTKKDFKIDEKSIEEKGRHIMSIVDSVEEEIDKDNYENAMIKINKIWDKIKDLRKSGLESENAEYSVGNLIFKLLRRNGYISKIMKMKKESYDKQFESSEDKLSNLLYLLDDVSSKIKEASEDAYLSYNCDEEFQCVEIKYGYGSEYNGFEDDIKVYYDKIPIILERENYGSGPLGEWRGNRQESFNSLEELVNDIKSDFGI